MSSFHRMREALSECEASPESRIDAIIKANHNRLVMSQDGFDAWIMGPKANLFKRRAAEILWTMRRARTLADHYGEPKGWAVARQMERMDEFMKLARADSVAPSTDLAKAA